MSGYKEGIKMIRPHGPCLLNEVIRFANTFTSREAVSQANQFYTILIVISQGQNLDSVGTADAIVEAAKNPLSIIIVAVGDKVN
jgi:hypothetical protein